MNDAAGRLINCPECYLQGKKQILGKVLDNGNLIVLRFHHGTTIVRAENYSIVCGCGYEYNVSGTTVVNQYGK